MQTNRGLTSDGNPSRGCGAPQAKGMRDAFSSQADFSGLVQWPGLSISKVIHVAVVDVNEEGTEAAAGTAVGMGRSARLGVVFRADHPFLLAIRHKPTGTLLFLGRVADPAK